ncbi:class I SAM-dependent methyltransferase [Paramagnetospirillum kuznetsovii]|uniref:Class I SAM-dependent methyltransferase n=1 Tax=Paramagnetospirillum kuznetsovii TaxID=2053833 RepID=A0A364P1X4_9PROT|nr:class I SAM-dependent methyltransferase [Paramagnetospirillum kuznetsovii]RAU23115.1 class I SAM-dependent methyltransferase [Paramagnetospirillum kuznetsovii]
MTLDIQTAFDSAARSYDGERRQLIPCFTDFYGAAVGLVAEFAPADARILDLGAGTGLLSALVAQALPDAAFTLSDLSEGMLAHARERFAGTATQASIRVMDHLALADTGAFDVVMSGLSIHHLEDDGKRALYAASVRALRPGGLFVNADQVSGDTPAMEGRYWQHWFRSISASGLSKSSIDAAIERQKLDRRAPLEPQLAWLREAGLREVECRYKNASFAVICGVK